MHKTLALWRADHLNFAKLLQLLDVQLERFHAGATPQYDLMLETGERLSHDLDDIVNGSIPSRGRVEKAAPAIHHGIAQSQTSDDRLVRAQQPRYSDRAHDRRRSVREQRQEQRNDATAQLL